MNDPPPAEGQEFSLHFLTTFILFLVVTLNLATLLVVILHQVHLNEPLYLEALSFTQTYKAFDYQWGPLTL